MTDIKIPTPEELEQGMLEREKQPVDPLDSHANFFHLYIFRFQNQVKLMSQKQILKLVASLTDSEYNQKTDVDTLLHLLKNLNLKSVMRVVNNTVEYPLNEDEIKSMSTQEQKAFDLMDDLLAVKYMTSFQKVTDASKLAGIQDVVKHQHHEKEFNRRSQLEKDAFSTANQLIATKTLLIQYTVLEQVKLEEDKKKEEENETKG